MEPEDTIDYNLRKTWFNVSKMYNRTASDYMGSMSLAMIVLNIDMFEGTPSTQLGKNMGMESTSLSRSLNKLEDIGVIERKPDPNDKTEGKSQGGKVLGSFAQGGWISGPQSGYGVSLDGGRSTSFIGHGTEYVATKSDGSAFVVPFDTMATCLLYTSPSPRDS